MAESCILDSAALGSLANHSFIADTLWLWFCKSHLKAVDSDHSFKGNKTWL